MLPLLLVQVSTQKGVRADMYRQHLKPALGRPNLTVLTGGCGPAPLVLGSALY